MICRNGIQLLDLRVFLLGVVTIVVVVRRRASVFGVLIIHLISTPRSTIDKSNIKITPAKYIHSWEYIQNKRTRLCVHNKEPICDHKQNNQSSTTQPQELLWEKSSLYT